jgi:hypothetical protein
MDAHSFDRWTAALARHPSRRATLRLLTAGVFTTLSTWRGAPLARAQPRPDRDGDGLYDDDETDVYGTNPDVSDTDGDGTGDGEEIYNRDNGLGGPSDPLVPDGGGPAPVGCAAGLTDCGGVCVDLVNDRLNCGACGAACAEFVNCWESNCGGMPDPPATVTCASGLANCGSYCADIRTDAANCGLCGWACSSGSICMGGFCTLAECPAGTSRCGAIGMCIDTFNDAGNCGGCGNACPAGFVCCGAACVDISSDPDNCGGCGKLCFDPWPIGVPTCENYQCV